MKLVACALLAACTAAPEDPFAATPSAYADRVLALDPAGYWRLDETDGVTLHDASPAANHARTHSDPRLGDEGVDRSAHFSGRAQYAQVESRDGYSLAPAWDDFARGCIVTAGSCRARSWGAAWQLSSWHYFTTGDGTAWIDPHGDPGPFEQIWPLDRGDGEVQIRARWGDGAVAVVAEREDDRDFVRAELSGDTLALIETRDGRDTTLATSPLGPTAGWWYVRLQYDGAELRARAWTADADQPQTWLVATASRAATGAVGVRSTGSIAAFQAFRARTLGLTLHLLARLDPDQPRDTTQLLGKGDHSGFTSATAQEYHLRYVRDVDGQHLKSYAFNQSGGFGAGVSFDAVETERWYDLVVEYDPGDYLDASAGVHMFVDGVELPAGAGAKYHSKSCVEERICWQIDPVRTGAPLRFGTSDGTGFFAGNLDEIAVFPRLLSADERDQLRIR